MRARFAAALVATALGAPLALSAPSTPAAQAATQTYGEASGVTPPKNACGNWNLSSTAVAMQNTAKLGVKMVRCDLSWWTVQPTKTTWNWTPFDNTVSAASYFGLQVLFTPQFTPPWARPNPLPAGTTDGSHVPPVNLADYTNFVKEAALRYAPAGAKRPATLLGDVTRWEIWNEPNIPGFWNPVDPARYTQMLKGAYQAIKSVDANAQVISGGLAPASNINGNMAPDTFMTALGDDGGLAYVTGVGIHPYSFPAWPSEQIGWNPMVNHVPRMYAAMQSFGYGNLKIWATEVGWPTSSQSDQTVRYWDNNQQVGTEPFQALALYDLYKTWFRYSYAGPLVLYSFRDKCVDPTSWWCSMGIQRADGTAKPAFAVVKSVLRLPVGSL